VSYKAVIGATAANVLKIRITVIGLAKLLQTFANVHFGEAAPQRKALQRTAAMGRSR
jgi:hypothetical protein